MQFYLFLRNVTVIIVKSFTCQLQLSIIVGKLHHANSVSGKHSGYIIKLKGSENYQNFTDFSALLLLH